MVNDVCSLDFLQLGAFLFPADLLSTLLLLFFER
jgi:hypothetical protein